jgi:hypothetical protein
MSAAPAMTRQKARKRAPISSGPEPIGSWNAMMAARVGGHGGERDDLDAVADPEAAGRGVEGDHSGDHRGERPRAQQAEQRLRWRPVAALSTSHTWSAAASGFVRDAVRELVLV